MAGQTHFDLGLSSGLVADLGGIRIHVNLSFVFSLSKKDLGPCSQASLQTDAQYSFNLQRKECEKTALLPKVSSQGREICKQVFQGEA